MTTACTGCTRYARAFELDWTIIHWSLQLLESHVEKIEGFNTSRVPRSDYQSGADAKFTHRFRMRAPIFVPRSRDGDLPFPPVDCHPWILEAASKSSFYAINPARPRLFGIEDGRILDLARCAPNRFVKGDIVLAVFTVTVVVSKKSWGTQLCPVELVRVANSDPTNWLNPADYAVPVIDSSVRASLADGEELKGQSNPSSREGETNARDLVFEATSYGARGSQTRAASAAEGRDSGLPREIEGSEGSDSGSGSSRDRRTSDPSSRGDARSRPSSSSSFEEVRSMDDEGYSTLSSASAGDDTRQRAREPEPSRVKQAVPVPTKRKRPEVAGERGKVSYALDHRAR